jgi:hypothetical protein
MLGWVLPSATEENISGDLLEQYQDSILPARGRTRADRWYVKQVFGFLWRLCAVFVVLRVVAVAGRDVVDAFWPPQYWAVAGAYRFRSAVTTYAAILTYAAAGMFAGYRTGRATTGSVITVATEVFTYVITLAFDVPLYLAVIRPDPERLHIFEVTGGWGETLGLSFMLLPIVAAIGALGGLAGKYARALVRPRVTG